MKIRWSLFKNKIIKDEFGGSTLEQGLLWALGIILFLLLVGWVSDIYGWIESKFDGIFAFDLE